MLHTVPTMSGNDALFLDSSKRQAGPRRWLRRAALGVLGLGFVSLVAYLVFLRMTRVEAPRVAAAVREAAEKPLEVRGPRAYVGESWLGRERGIWEGHLAGEPYAMGWAQGRLGNRLFLETEDYMFGEMARYVPSKTALWLIRTGVRMQYRHVGDLMPVDRAEEIAGMARGVDDLHGDFLPIYHRLVFYHALHDITQGLEHSPLLGCSAFAASGPASSNGHLVIGRNFDFEGPQIFDRDKAILFFKPRGKIPFASVAWLGMAGVITGLNAEGIFVSINAARSDDKGGEGMPVEILVREIMEQAHSIDEVVALVKKTPVMVPDFYLVGDGKTGESAVIERTPRRTEVRRANRADGTIVLTNHALAQSFAADAENDRLKRYLTSGARYKRMEELVRHFRGQIDARKALEILRDKKGPGGVELGLGNRNALDAIIATHSVVVDATALTIWVSAGPHLTGRYVGFDLHRELLGDNRPEPVDLPADPVGDSDEYRAYQLAQLELHAAERLQKSNPERALEQARRAEGLEEKLPEPHRLIGDLLRARGDRDGARRQYQRFLELSPPYLKDIEDVKGILSTL
jgi:isopenicillin-N N-acyltransferase-like protein